MKNKWAVFTVRTKFDVRDEAHKVADELGVSLNLVMSNYINHFIKTKSIEFRSYEEIKKTDTPIAEQQAIDPTKPLVFETK